MQQMLKGSIGFFAIQAKYAISLIVNQYLFYSKTQSFWTGVPSNVLSCNIKYGPTKCNCKIYKKYHWNKIKHQKVMRIKINQYICTFPFLARNNALHWTTFLELFLNTLNEVVESISHCSGTDTQNEMSSMRTSNLKLNACCVSFFHLKSIWGRQLTRRLSLWCHYVSYLDWMDQL